MGHLEDLRRFEIESLKPWIKSGSHVLEIGGGNGFQASIIASWSCTVVSIDIPNRALRDNQYHPVLDYDGRRLPFDDSHADVVFSSNVLEHVKDLDALFREIHRVIKPDGLAIHVLPSATWRLWTSLSHYAFLMKHVAGRSGSPASPANGEPEVGSMRELVREHGLSYVARRTLFSGPHGEYPNALSELYFFSRRSWRRLFEREGFEMVSEGGGRLFYTGYSIIPQMPMGVRRKMSRALGSSMHVFVTRSLP